MTDYHKLKLIILGAHLTAIAGLIYMFSWSGILAATVMYIIYYAYGMILGFHRIFAHNSFEASTLSYRLMLIAGSLSGMGSSFGWVGQHRWHHAHTDIPELDPYWAKPGAVNKIISWALYANREFKISTIKDLLRNSDHVFMHKHYYKILFTWIAVLTLISPWAVVYLWALPSMMCYTSLSIVGVFGHVVGTQPYHQTDASRDSHLLNLISLGESYQNFHHYKSGYPIYGKYDVIGKVSAKFFKIKE